MTKEGRKNFNFSIKEVKKLSNFDLSRKKDFNLSSKAARTMRKLSKFDTSRKKEFQL